MISFCAGTANPAAVDSIVYETAGRSRCVDSQIFKPQTDVKLILNAEHWLGKLGGVGSSIVKGELYFIRIPSLKLT